MSCPSLFLTLLSDLITFRMKSNSLAKHTKPVTDISLMWSTIPYLWSRSLSHHTELLQNIPGSFTSLGLCVCGALAWSTFSVSCTKLLLFLQNSAQLLPPLALLSLLSFPACDRCLLSKDPYHLVLSLIIALTALFYNELFQAVMFLSCRTCHSHCGVFSIFPTWCETPATRSWLQSSCLAQLLE